MKNIKSIEWYNTWCKKFTLKNWNKRLDIPIMVNNNMKANGCFTYNKRLDHVRMGQRRISVNFNKCRTHDNILDVLKHELCHWYCYTTGKNFDDGDKDFERELLKVEASSSHAGCFNKEYSKFIQKSIITDQTTIRGFKQVKYKKVTVDECFQKIKETNHPLKWLKKDYIVSAQKVFFNDKEIGLIFKGYDKNWISVLPIKEDKDLRRYGFKTRKSLVDELLKGNIELIKSV